MGIRIRDPETFQPWFRDPWWNKFWYKINIPDPQHCCRLIIALSYLSAQYSFLFCVPARQLLRSRFVKTKCSFSYFREQTFFHQYVLMSSNIMAEWLALMGSTSIIVYPDFDRVGSASFCRIRIGSSMQGILKTCFHIFSICFLKYLKLWHLWTNFLTIWETWGRICMRIRLISIMLMPI